MYLPSNSELNVSIWRLTGRSKIWYEWYAESFLPVLSPPPPLRPLTPLEPDGPSHQKSMGTAAANLLTVNIPSPLASALASPTAIHGTIDMSEGGIRMGGGDAIAGTVIKIGQTALHNPEGRGSWTGL